MKVDIQANSFDLRHTLFGKKVGRKSVGALVLWPERRQPRIFGDLGRSLMESPVESLQVLPSAPGTGSSPTQAVNEVSVTAFQGTFTLPEDRASLRFGERSVCFQGHRGARRKRFQSKRGNGLPGCSNGPFPVVGSRVLGAYRHALSAPHSAGRR